MKRANAFALVTQHGGKPCERVTKDTGVVIVGELGWPLQEDGRPSKSLTQAKSYGVPMLLVEQARGHTDSKGQFVLPVEKTNHLDADQAFCRRNPLRRPATSSRLKASTGVS